MKTKLLLLSFFITSLGYSQTINNFDSAPMSMYAIINTTTTTIDQSPSGLNAVWDFTLDATGETSTDTYEAVTMGSSIENLYPGTTSALTTTTSTMDEAKVFTKNSSNTVSITGVEGEGLILNYITDNAFIGTFPLNFNDTNNSDNVSGTFTFNGNSGSFTGTVLTTVDAYGMLTMNDVGSGVYNGSVTRLKIEQNISLSIGFPIGTVNQTSYYYYNSNNGDLVFRTTDAAIATPLGSENILVMESLLTNTFGINDSSFEKVRFSVFPNPVNNDNLNFTQPINIRIESITIFDISGREIINKTTNENAIKINQLNSGLYLLCVKTDRGILSTKFIKE